MTTIERVLCKEIEALEAELAAVRSDMEERRMVDFERAGDMAAMRKERDEARAERDALRARVAELEAAKP